MLLIQQTTAFLYQTQSYVKHMGTALSREHVIAVAGHSAFIIAQYLNTRNVNGPMYMDDIYAIVVDAKFVDYSPEELMNLVERAFNK